MIFGLHHCLMDEKGRTALPASLRTDLLGEGQSFILTQSLYEPCLVGMTEHAFTAIADKVRSLPASSPASALYKRFFIAPATRVAVDKVGRVLVPKEQREYASLERDCVWLGALDTIELWSRAKYDELRRKHSEDTNLDDIRKVLAEHGL